MRRDTRETSVMTAVIERYIRTGEPVASGSVARESRLGLSSASIRAIMAALTEKGYLEQPHVSAGRVPTAKAFRLYVDTLLAPRPLSKGQKEALVAALGVADADISQILRRASAVVASHSMQLGVVLAPRRGEMRWRTIEFSPVSANLVLAVLILDGGSVRTRMVAVQTAYSADELARFSNCLNSHFKGCTLAQARLRIETELELAEEKLEEMWRKALALSIPALDDSGAEREFFMDGIGQVSHTSAFADAGRLRELLSFMEERPKILDLLERTMASPDVSVSFIQGEYDATPWAVVSAPYAPREDKAPLGVVSAIGLLHMNYATVLPVVGAVAASVASVMRSRL
ncbi:Heat-inducible transcription repressor HrcA [uncultured delta proteobacterium]|uniref:Heat-inducible transcription repressor HrcA n=1 Tax=uncultured delta proteobacterium TaxID=34034 RepID=A0A212KC88_9DELT|nr:Heat-inducible transcription repressor HrcA [uncultured delta proteobacterium]